MISHDDFCDVTNIKTGVTVSGEITDFRDKQYVAVSIQRKMKINMQWQEKFGKYIGSAVGMEFETIGPKTYNVRTTR